jgi:hypothetical protein
MASHGYYNLPFLITKQPLLCLYLYRKEIKQWLQKKQWLHLLQHKNL